MCKNQKDILKNQQPLETRTALERESNSLRWASRLNFVPGFLILFIATIHAYSQDLIYISDDIKVNTSVNLFVKGGIQGKSGGEIDNDGNIYLKNNPYAGTEDWTNNAASTFLKSTGNSGEVVFNSSGPQNIAGTATTTFYDLTIDNSGSGIVLGKDIYVTNILTMTAGDIDLQNSNIDLGETGNISDESETTRIKVGDINNNTGTIRATCTINNFTDLNPGNLGVLITTPDNLGSTTIVRGHQVQQGTGTYSGNTSIARYIELRNTSDEIIDFELDANNKLEMKYWDAELNGQTEAELEQYQWVKESTEEWWSPLMGNIETINNLSTPDDSPYSSYFDEPNWYSLNFYGKFTLSSTSDPLPIEWLYFTADWQDETYSAVQLEWATATESNSDFYEIQRSDDMDSWETIKTTDAAGFSAQNLEYTDYDESPPADADIIYYRLKQVDFDGNYEYSDMDAVLAPDNAIEIISIYPNPADDEITIEIESLIDTSVFMYVWDKLGKTVILRQAEIVKGKNEFSLNISQLASSIYTILVITENGNHKTSREFVK